VKKSKFEKYIMRDVWHKSYPTDFHKEVVKPALSLAKNKGKAKGYPPFALSWVPITQAFEMAPKAHVHDWDEFLMFIGGDANNMLDLGGEVELWLGDDAEHMEKFTFTKTTMVHLPGGLWHCPLNFKKVNDPAKPILFENLMFVDTYTLIDKDGNKVTKP
jgi:hypothetical protein